MTAVNFREDMRTMLAAVGGLGAQFTGIELGLKIAVGALTCVYLCIRIWKLVKTGKD